MDRISCLNSSAWKLFRAFVIEIAEKPNEIKATIAPVEKSANLNPQGIGKN